MMDPRKLKGILLLTIAVMFLALRSVVAAGSSPGASLAAEEKHTAIPFPTVDVRILGASGNGVTFDTEVLQKAINTCAGTGGTVLLPPGRYLTKPLELRSNMTLRLEKGAVLLGSPGHCGSSGQAA